MSTETYTPRRSAGESTEESSIRIARRRVDPMPGLLDELTSLADDLDQQSAAAGGADRSLIGRVLFDSATEVRRIVKEYQP